MAITPQLIKELREMTAAGMMDCKKALEATNGNLDDAVIWLRENGLSKAAKKADRIAAEGVVFAKTNGKKGIIFEINSETDFVSKNDKFMNLVAEIGEALLNSSAKNLSEALKIKLKSNETIEEACINATATIGEKIEIRRFEMIENGTLSVYNHANNRISVLLQFNTEITKEDAYNLCMHVAAMSPKYLTKENVPQEFIDTEMHIIKETTDPKELAGKPQDIVEKILQGKLNKRIAEITLLEQTFVMDEKQKVDQFLKSKNTTLKTVHRFEVGEGIQKAATDFASEVAAQLKG